MNNEQTINKLVKQLLAVDNTTCPFHAAALFRNQLKKGKTTHELSQAIKTGVLK